jgi:arginyl-tRNA synthetase
VRGTEATVKQQLLKAIEDAARWVASDALGALGEPPEFCVERPPDPGSGDYATNIALVLARKANQPARFLAERLAAVLAKSCDFCGEVTVAGPGFINVTFRPDCLQAVVRQALTEDAAYGTCEALGGRRIQVGFPAADPNGPAHFGRGAAIGEVLASLVRAAGAEVVVADRPPSRVDRLVCIRGPHCLSDRASTASAPPAANCAAERRDVLVYQDVRLLRGGESVRTSKRGDGPVTLGELIDEVGSETARFFFLLRSHDSRLEFDLDLATAESERNPVYCVQSAHARVCGVLTEAGRRGLDAGASDLSPPTGTREVVLIRRIADLPDEIRLAALRDEPHRLTRYTVELAAALHAFCLECRVFDDDQGVSAACLCLAKAAGIALRNTLRLLAITAPERM